MQLPEEFFDRAERLKAVADPDHLRIISLLFSGEQSVGEIASALDEEMVKISHHLGILRRSKILTASKRGRFVIYALHPDVFIAPTGPNDALQLHLGCCHLGLENQRSDA